MRWCIDFKIVHQTITCVMSGSLRAIKSSQCRGKKSRSENLKAFNHYEVIIPSTPDTTFVYRLMDRIKELIQANLTVVISSHWMSVISIEILQVILHISMF